MSCHLHRRVAIQGQGQPYEALCAGSSPTCIQDLFLDDVFKSYSTTIQEESLVSTSGKFRYLRKEEKRDCTGFAIPHHHQGLVETRQDSIVNHLSLQHDMSRRSPCIRRFRQQGVHEKYCPLCYLVSAEENTK